MTSPAPVLRAGLRSASPTTGVQRVTLLVLALTLASTCLLTSAGQGVEAGHVPWGRNSVLHVITDLLNLTHNFPTARGTEVKWLTQSVGAAAALICAGAAWFLRTRRDPDDALDGFEAEPAGVGAGAVESAPQRPFAWLTGMSPGTAAQVALVLFVCWSAMSAFWSPWSEASLYEAMRIGIACVLAIGIAHSLSVRSARLGALILAIVLVATAAIGVWYHYERNPVQRLKYPIGNPIFLAACLLPAFTVLGGWIIGEVLTQRNQRTAGKLNPWLRVATGVLGLLVLGWAFVLADSRGPGLGLVLGLLVTAILLAGTKLRLILSLGAVVIAILFASLKLWPVSWLLSRPDTVRLRLHAWKYAFNLFLTRPDIGRGQGAYVLLAQEQSRGDAERDPQAFTAELLGHAHNEWLEILADLGAFGLALILTTMGLTLWAAVHAWRRMPNVKDRCILAGLLAGFLGIVFESLSDVALRMPGLPVIFFSVWGLLWAMSRDPGPSSCIRAARVTRPAGIRKVGLIACIAGAWLVMIVATGDWKAALSEPNIARYAGQLQWDRSLEAAAIAARHRLAIEARLVAFYGAASVARDAAAFRTGQLQEMLRRAAEPREPATASGTDPGAVMRLAHEDVQNFERYFDLGINVGETLLNYCPGYPNVAGFISDLWFLRAQIAALQEQTGPLPLTPLPADSIEQARLWMQREWQFDRLSPKLGLRLLSLSGSRPMIERLDMLRIPLRSGPVFPGVEAALFELMQAQDFGAVMDGLLAAARPAVTGADWIDPYSPETLRLAAIANKGRGAFEQSAAMAGEAARLLEPMRSRFPIAAASAMADQAEYLLLSDPDHPARAVAAIQQALDKWPQQIQPAQRAALERSRLLYLLAAGKEEEARSALTDLLGPSRPADAVDRNIGMAYVELCRRFLPLPPQARPASLKNWLQRALLLAPSDAEPLMLAATITLEEGQEEIAIQNLEALEQLSMDRERLAMFLGSLLNRFSDSPALQAFAASRMPGWTQTTQPATRPSHPATAPATAPLP